MCNADSVSNLGRVFWAFEIMSFRLTHDISNERQCSNDLERTRVRPLPSKLSVLTLARRHNETFAICTALDTDRNEIKSKAIGSCEKY